MDAYPSGTGSAFAARGALLLTNAFSFLGPLGRSRRSTAVTRTSRELTVCLDHGDPELSRVENALQLAME